MTWNIREQCSTSALIVSCSIWANTHETNTILELLGPDDLIHNMAAQNEWVEINTQPILPQPMFSGGTRPETMRLVHIPNTPYLLLSTPYLSLA